MTIPLSNTREEYIDNQQEWLQAGARATITDQYLPLLKGAPTRLSAVSHYNGWANRAVPDMDHCLGMHVEIQELRGERGIYCRAIDDAYNATHFIQSELLIPEQLVWPYYFFETGIQVVEEMSEGYTDHVCFARGKLTDTLYHIIGEDETAYYARQITSEKGYPFWGTDLFYGKKELFDCDVPQAYTMEITDNTLKVTERTT